MQLTIDQAMQLAVHNHQTGQLAQAEEIYRRVLIQQPNNPDALHLLGVIAHQAGRLDAGIELIRQAIAINPGLAHYHNNLGNVLRDKGISSEAIAAYGNAIRLKPDYAEAYYNLGVALRGVGQLDGAIAAYRSALHIKPNYANAWNNLGTALREKGLRYEAIAAFRQAVLLNPDLTEAHNNLGNTLLETGRFDEAVGAIREAIRFKPDLVDAHNNLSIALREMGSLDEAIASCREALNLNPDYAEAHDVLSSILLLKGDLAQGWVEYEWRWRLKDFPSPRGKFSQPRWDGAALNGGTIFLHPEGGFGDVIQFVRYLPMVVDRGGTVVLECQKQMHPLLETPGIVKLISADEPLPTFDVHCPLMSLPLVFGTRIDTIPATVPYLKANPSLIESWNARLGPRDGKLRVGLAWAGGVRFKLDRTRSLTLERLAPFGRVGDVRFFSLQKGPPGEQAKTPPAGLQLIDLGPDLKNFSDTAAVMSSMDLIISTDTSVAHLAGAMGLPIWVMLQFMPDWRWLLDREDSPWYPTMRLFRQKAWGDWPEVIERVAQALNALCSERAKKCYK